MGKLRPVTVMCSTISVKISWGALEDSKETDADRRKKSNLHQEKSTQVTQKPNTGQPTVI